MHLAAMVGTPVVGYLVLASKYYWTLYGTRKIRNINAKIILFSPCGQSFF
ncbi:MAG: hypothetical protein CM1200mP16_06300 [Nitrospina sp.]|nr:MAG: hypothetical protein CM1200mP16_06300 [Nitrospina sp.]